MSLQSVTHTPYKILVLGDLATGKTSFISQYSHGLYMQNYKATIGVDFQTKKITLEDGSQRTLHLWDIAGQERYGNMTRVYYKGASAALILFDVTRAQTFENAKKWKVDLDSKLGIPHIPVVLVANKIDMLAKDTTFGDDEREKVQAYCKDKEFAGYVETSVKENRGVDEAMQIIISKITMQAPQDREAKVGLQLTQQGKKEDSCFSCET